MAGSDVIFDNALANWGYYGTLPAASDAMIASLWLASGLVSDSTMRTYATVAAIEAGASAEATTGTVSDYARVTLGSVTSVTDTTNHRWDMDCNDITFAGLGGANNGVIGALVVHYDSDTGAGTDSNTLPISKHSLDATPDNSDLVAQIPSGGFARATG